MNRKIGFKGFNDNLVCRSLKYSVGETYQMPENKIRLCSTGYHFCNKLKDVFTYYRNDGNNKFAIVEALGKVIDGDDKSVTNEIKILKVLSSSEIKQILLQEDRERIENDVFCLDVVRELQSLFNLSIGGSVSLFPQGIMLNRDSGGIDFDIILPYYQILSLDNRKKEDSCIEEIVDFDGKASGNDFSQTYGLTTKDGRFIKMDVRVKPEQKYTIAKYGEFEYKVCDVLTILEAKMRYAVNGNKKHRDDIHDLIGYNPKKNRLEDSSREKVFTLDSLFN